MSSTNRGSERNLGDHYATPPELCQLICDRLKEDGIVKDPTHVLEPGCGEGFFLDAISKTWPDCHGLGVEINEHLSDLAQERGHDVANEDLLSFLKDNPEYRYDAVIGNPPFSFADDFLEALWPHAARGGIISFLLRLDALGTTGRFDRIWSKFPPCQVYVMPQRPGFTPDGGTDSIEYMVCCWSPGHEGGTEMTFLDNRHINNKWAGLSTRTRKQYADLTDESDEWV